MSTPTTDADANIKAALIKTEAALSQLTELQKRLDQIFAKLTPTTVPDKPETHRTLEWHNLESTIIQDKIQALRDEMSIMPKTVEFLMKYEKEFASLCAEAKLNQFKRDVCAQRALVAEKFADRPELVADAMRGFDQMLQENQKNQEKVRDWDEYFLDRDLTKYSVWRDMGWRTSGFRA